MSAPAIRPIKSSPARPPGNMTIRVSVAIVVVLFVGSWGSLLLGGAGVSGLFSSGNWTNVRDFLGAMLGMDTALTPGATNAIFFDVGQWARMAGLAYETLVMSVLAIWIAVIGMIVTVMPGARPSSAETGPVRMAIFAGVRGIWVTARAVPELVWALVLG